MTTAHVNWDHGKHGLVCPACGHDTTGSQAVHCHECGAKLVSAANTER